MESCSLDAFEGNSLDHKTNYSSPVTFPSREPRKRFGLPFLFFTKIQMNVLGGVPFHHGMEE